MERLSIVEQVFLYIMHYLYRIPTLIRNLEEYFWSLRPFIAFTYYCVAYCCYHAARFLLCEFMIIRYLDP